MLILTAAAKGSTVASFDFEKSKISKAPASSGTASLSNNVFEGKHALHIKNKIPAKPARTFGLFWQSDSFPLKSGRYVLRAALRLPKGYGMKLELEAFNAQGRRLHLSTIYIGSPPKNQSKWFLAESFLSAWNPECVTGRIRLRMPVYLEQEVFLDKIEVIKVPVTNERRNTMTYPVYEGRNPSLMTEGDIPGPDGLIYPDFSYAGARPDKCILDQASAHTVSLRNFGGIPGKNIDVALKRAIASLPETGGVIQLEPGEYRIKDFLNIRRDNIAIAGAGSEKTRIKCEYDVHESGIDFYSLSSGAVISPRQPIHVIARPQESGSPIQSIILELDGKEIGKFTRKLHSGNYSMLVGRLPENCADGEHTIRAIVNYSGKKTIDRKIKIRINREKRQTLPQEPFSGLITFRGSGVHDKSIKLSEDAKRGTRILELKSPVENLKSGDLILLQADETDAFRKKIGNQCRWGVSRQVLLTIAEVNGNQLILEQPIRVDYPVADSARIQYFSPVRGCGIQGISFEVENDFWFHTIHIRNALDCKVRDVTVSMCGRNPVWFENTKFSTIENCKFIDAWFKGGGKSAYVGFERSYDCLMDNVETHKMRHAPVLQWSASGNVIRNSVFLHSDAQWHAGWPHENLMENCRIVTDTKQYGAYGHSFFSTGPADTSHGPGGPRNVVYYCDADSFESPVKLTGNNDNWMFVYNRFISRIGDGVFVMDGTNDLILRQNHILLKKANKAMLITAGVDSPGIDLSDNKVFASHAELVKGLIVPKIEKENQLLPKSENISRPKPPVISIYNYQKGLRSCK
jgi:hypothetical protein